MHIGFSTGSIALGDFNKALALLDDLPTDVIELSALREHELFILSKAITSLDLNKYKYISVHAPSKLVNYSENQIIPILRGIAERGWFVIVHPDIIQNYSLWKQLGKYLCIENMDKRKPAGRTSNDMKNLFDYFVDASFCLDLAHAKQVDPTMLECYLMLRDFAGRLAQIHLSDVTSDSKHVPLNVQAISAYSKLAHMIPENIPIILESTVQPSGILEELRLASLIFEEEAVTL